MRRKIVLTNIKSLIVNQSDICDFGCGDGEYIRYFSALFPDCKFHGVDISADMINVAESRNGSKYISWEVSGDGISINRVFDLVYSSAVFAHVSDEVVTKLFLNIFNHIKKDGSFVICEQTAPCRYEGTTYIRRTVYEYIGMLQKAGFCEFECFVIDFWLHRILFERKIGKKFIAQYKKRIILIIILQ